MRLYENLKLFGGFIKNCVYKLRCSIYATHMEPTIHYLANKCSNTNNAALENKYSCGMLF